MRVSRQLINLAQIDEINLSGRGGREREVSVLLPLWRHVNAPLYDYAIDVDGEIYRLEVKKQANLQWFDSGKYHKLASADRDIRIMFLIHNNGRIDVVAVALLGEFLDWLSEHRESDGWNEEVLSFDVGATTWSDALSKEPKEYNHEEQRRLQLGDYV